MDYENESDASDNEELITTREGLSAETYAALFQFMNKGPEDDDEEEEEPTITDDTVFATYTPNDMLVIAATIKRLQTSSDASATRTMEVLKERVLEELEASLPVDACTVLNRNGIVRLRNVLSADICDRCLAAISKDLAHEIAHAGAVMPEARFGNVLSRDNRWDMYLTPEGVYREALEHMLGSATAPLAVVLNELFCGCSAEFHEFSSLISDPGASSQPIHPDTQHQDQCPLYTCFVALQDVNADMGGTIFLPRTTPVESHAQFKDSTTKDAFLGGSEYRQGLLRKGDVAIMDSRTLHCGDANWKSRRVLFYFTLRNPQFYDSSPPVGSLMAGLKLSHGDLLDTCRDSI